MRDTTAYPITTEEIVWACDEAAAREVKRYQAEGVVGDIKAAALALAAERVMRSAAMRVTIIEALYGKYVERPEPTEELLAALIAIAANASSSDLD